MRAARVSIIRRVGAARASLLAAAFCFVGAVLTAYGDPYAVMVAGSEVKPLPA